MAPGWPAWPPPGAREMAPGRTLTARRADGSEFPIEASVAGFAAGGRRFVTGILRDVSGRVAAARALAESEARLRTIVDTVPVGLLMAELPSGRILGGNAHLETLVRHPVLHSPDLDSYGEWVAFHADGSRVAAHEYPLARLVQTGEEASLARGALPARRRHAGLDADHGPAGARRGRPAGRRRRRHGRRGWRAAGAARRWRRARRSSAPPSSRPRSASPMSRWMAAGCGSTTGFCAIAGYAREALLGLTFQRDHPSRRPGRRPGAGPGAAGRHDRHLCHGEALHPGRWRGGLGQPDRLRGAGCGGPAGPLHLGHRGHLRPPRGRGGAGRQRAALPHPVRADGGGLRAVGGDARRHRTDHRFPPAGTERRDRPADRAAAAGLHRPQPAHPVPRHGRRTGSPPMSGPPRPASRRRWRTRRARSAAG